MELSAPSVEYKPEVFKLRAFKTGSVDYWYRRSAQVVAFWKLREEARATKLAELTATRDKLDNIAAQLRVLSDQSLGMADKPDDVRETGHFFNILVFTMFDKYLEVLLEISKIELQLMNDTKVYEKYLADWDVEKENESLLARLETLREENGTEQPHGIANIGVSLKKGENEDRDRQKLVTALNRSRHEKKMNTCEFFDHFLTCLFPPDPSKNIPIVTLEIVEDRWRLVKESSIHVKELEKTLDELWKRQEKACHQLETLNCDLRLAIAREKEVKKIGKMSKKQLVKHILKGHLTLRKEDPLRKMRLITLDSWMFARGEDVKFCEEKLAELVDGAAGNQGAELDKVLWFSNRGDEEMKKLFFADEEFWTLCNNF